jgi:hypothetical protein
MNKKKLTKWLFAASLLPFALGLFHMAFQILMHANSPTFAPTGNVFVASFLITLGIGCIAIATTWLED